MARVLVIQSIKASSAGWDEALELLTSAGHEFETLDWSPNEVQPPIPTRPLKRAEALFVETAPVTAAMMRIADRLRVIGKGGIGTDNIDMVAATQRGILVCNTPGSNSAAVAEHTLGLILALTRAIPRLDRLTRAGHGWSPWPPAQLHDLAGKVLGVIGTGNVGKAVVRRALAFEVRVVAHDPIPDHAFAGELGIGYVSLSELLEVADIVTVHVPLTDETRNLIGPPELNTMKPSTFLVNVSRGGVVDEAAIQGALDRGRLAGVAIDVFSEEPARRHPLFEDDRVLVTPHAAGISPAALRNARVTTAENIVRALRGEIPSSAVNIDQLPSGNTYGG